MQNRVLMADVTVIPHRIERSSTCGAVGLFR